MSWMSSLSGKELLTPIVISMSVVLRALQWLLANNKYNRNIHINPNALVMLPEDGDLSDLQSISLDSTTEAPSGQDEDEDPYSTICSGSFVPSTTQRMTEQTFSATVTVSPATSESTYCVLASK